VEELLHTMGQKIREVRRGQNLTLSDVARMTGLTESLLSQIENSKANPSITTLLAISKALNTPAGSFFDTAEAKDSPVIRKNDRRLSRTSNLINYYLLTPSLEDSPIEVLYNEFQPGADTGDTIRHEGVECGIVLEGKLEVTIDGTVYILNAGDSITINSDQPHKIRNISDKTSTAIWIDSPPTF
jgi:transcriptional regulator with XRE-family HTH domain